MVQNVPALWDVLPVGLFLPRDGSNVVPLVQALILDQSLPSLSPLCWTAAFSLLFVVVGVLKFRRTEF